MDFLEIIKQSEKRLNKLRVITNFFDNADVVGISIRTKIIHDVFTSNTNLDSMKLELFHLQYTDTFLQLMQQLKKKIEQKYLLIQNEIKINAEFVANYKTEIKKDSFREEVIKCNLSTQLFLETAYDYLAFMNPAKANALFEVNEFKDKWGAEYYRQISDADSQKISNLETPLFHSYNIITIDKKLLGKLNIHRFKIKFQCGFQYNNSFFSLFEFIHTNEHLIFNHQINQFQVFEIKDFPTLNFAKNSSNKQDLIQTLTNKITDLEKQAKTSLKLIPKEVKLVIKEYYLKISSLSFLDDLQNVDEQTNILKSMLNLNIN